MASPFRINSLLAPASVRAADPNRAIPTAVIAVFLVAAGLVVLLADPARAVWWPVCPFHLITGLQCPGCGSSRALHALLSGEVAAALRWNPVVVSLLPLAGLALARGLGLSTQPLRARPAWIGLLVAVILTFSLIRNLPVSARSGTEAGNNADNHQQRSAQQ